MNDRFLAMEETVSCKEQGLLLKAETKQPQKNTPLFTIPLVVTQVFKKRVDVALKDMV